MGAKQANREIGAPVGIEITKKKALKAD